MPLLLMFLVFIMFSPHSFGLAPKSTLHDTAQDADMQLHRLAELINELGLSKQLQPEWFLPHASYLESKSGTDRLKIWMQKAAQDPLKDEIPAGAFPFFSDEEKKIQLAIPQIISEKIENRTSDEIEIIVRSFGLGAIHVEAFNITQAILDFLDKHYDQYQHLKFKIRLEGFDFYGEFVENASFLAEAFATNDLPQQWPKLQHQVQIEHNFCFGDLQDDLSRAVMMQLSSSDITMWRNTHVGVSNDDRLKYEDAEEFIFAMKMNLNYPGLIMIRESLMPADEKGIIYAKQFIITRQEGQVLHQQFQIERIQRFIREKVPEIQSNLKPEWFLPYVDLIDKDINLLIHHMKYCASYSSYQGPDMVIAFDEEELQKLREGIPLIIQKAVETTGEIHIQTFGIGNAEDYDKFLRSELVIITRIILGLLDGSERSLVIHLYGYDVSSMKLRVMEEKMQTWILEVMRKKNVQVQYHGYYANLEDPIFNFLMMRDTKADINMLRHTWIEIKMFSSRTISDLIRQLRGNLYPGPGVLLVKDLVNGQLLTVQEIIMFQRNVASIFQEAA